jgi:hypothetical protein
LFDLVETGRRQGEALIMRSIKMLGLALVAMSAFAIMASSASAKEPVFYVGLPGTALSGTLLITIAQKTTVLLENFLEGELAGEKVVISCHATNGDGTAENPAGEAAAVVKNLTVTYTSCEVTTPNISGCEVKSAGEPNGTIKIETGNTEVAGWAEKAGEKAVAVLTGKGAKEEFVVLEFTTACKFPLGITKINVKGQTAANAKPAAEMSLMGELEFPKIKIEKYFTGPSTAAVEHKLKLLEVEAVGGLAKGPAVLVTTDFILLATGLLPWLGLLSAGGMGTRG